MRVTWPPIKFSMLKEVPLGSSGACLILPERPSDFVEVTTGVACSKDWLVSMLQGCTFIIWPRF